MASRFSVASNALEVFFVKPVFGHELMELAGGHARGLGRVFNSSATLGEEAP